MKPFFTKYLSNEGKIAEQDLPCLVLDTYTNKIIEYKKSEYGSNASEYYKSITLFLCRRDIKVGDKYIIAKTGEESIWNYEDNTDLDIATMKTLEVNNLVFKVIGKVSKEALGYTKEGDEFDYGEIAWQCDDGSDDIIIIHKDWEWDNWDSRDNIQSNLVFSIKDPYNHFH
jgi:hypothetical protein